MSGTDFVDNNDAGLAGTSGDDDSIAAMDGNDTVLAGAGDDTVDGGLGNDLLEGGTGADSLIGGDGDDTATYENATEGVSVSLATGLGTQGEAEGDTLAEIENLTGSDQNDVLEGDAGANTLSGGSGADTLIGGAGADALVGGADRDAASYATSGAGVDVNLTSGTGAGGDAEGDTLSGITDLIGSDHDDVLTGNTVFNVLDAGAGNDTVLGEAGSDTIIGGLGNDSLEGGGGSDVIVGDENSDFNATDPDALIWTPPGTATFSYATGANLGDGAAGGTNHRADVADTDVSGLQLFLPGGDLNITEGDTIGFSFIDENGQTVIVQSAAVQQTAFSTGADDTGVITAQGADQFGNQVAILIKLSNNDGSPAGPINPGNTFYDSDTDGLITNGTDVTLSSAQTTSAFSGAGDDTLRGDGGADTLLAGDGNDVLEGGAGGDVLDGGAGTDWASYESSDAAVTVSLDVGQANNQTGGIATDGGHATGDTLTGIENLQGSDFDDVLEGDGANNEILGGDGNDTLYGVVGNDLVQGGAGNDSVDGGFGADTVQGGIGDDTVDGGTGNDFVEGGDGNDHVIGGRGNDLVSGNDGNDIVEGKREDDTVLGHAGDDTVNGGEGNDLLSGGAGDDVFIYDATGFGNDTVDDFGDGNSGAIDDGDQTNNDFVDLSQIYTQANYDAAVAAGDIDPNVIKTPLQWMRADQADDGILNDSNAFGVGDSLTLNNGGSAVAASDLTFDNTAVLCFVRGTRIATARGEIAVEHLEAGDSVITRDNGYQRIRWIGSATREATGKLAPVLFKSGVLGNHTDLKVSPNHRMLLTGPMAELVSGDIEVLAPAKFMVNERDILRVEGGVVEYFHILFDRHEIIMAKGCWSESFHPGHVGWSTLCEDTRQEILGLFPELETDLDHGESVTARQVLDRRQTVIAFNS